MKRWSVLVRHEKVFKLLSTIIEDYEGDLHTRLASMIVDNKNNIISIGYALKKTHPFQKRYGKTPEHIYLHAEIDAIYKAIRKESNDYLNRCTIYVGRLKKREISKRKFIDMYGDAKPCSGCLGAIYKFGFKKVVYSKDSPLDVVSYGEIILKDN